MRPVSPPSRRAARDVAVLAVAAALVAGSLAWSDDAWPFAPFRMFSSAPTKSVKALALDAVRADGRVVRMPAEAFHLRRAELEGQAPRVVAHPRLLGDLLAAYNRRAPAGGRLVQLRLLERRTGLVAGRPRPSGRPDRGSSGPPAGIDWEVRVLAQWPPAPAERGA